jgi:RNA polymerase-binding transcription factor DksA
MSTRKGESKAKTVKKPSKKNTVASRSTAADKARTTAKPAAAAPKPILAAVPPRPTNAPREAKAVSSAPAARGTKAAVPAKAREPRTLAAPVPARETKVARESRAQRESKMARETKAAMASSVREEVEEPRRTPIARGGAFTQKDVKRFEQLLLGERQRLLQELGHIENHVLKRSLRETSGELSGYSFHMADVGTDAMEREKAFHFASAEGRALLDVNDALRRLYNGEYGICESCGAPVSKERLEVVPHARLCVSCKEKEERAQAGRSR